MIDSSNNTNKEKERKTIKKEDDKLNSLQKDLQKAIKDERYEDAAKIRDEIKKIEEKKNNKESNGNKED